MTVMQDPKSKTGNAPIVKIGHTAGPAFGQDTNCQAKGVAAAKPTDITFGK